jgi:hypothetical protein
MESNNMKFSDDPAVTLTIRLIMQGKVSWQFLFYFYNIKKSHLIFIAHTCNFLRSLMSKKERRIFPRYGKLHLEMHKIIFHLHVWCDHETVILFRNFYGKNIFSKLMLRNKNLFLMNQLANSSAISWNFY